MKKLFSLILALAMAFALCVPAFADENDPHPEKLNPCTCEEIYGELLLLIDKRTGEDTFDAWIYNPDGSFSCYGNWAMEAECEPGKIYHYYAETQCLTAAPAPAGPQTNVTMNITKNNTYTLTVPTGVTVTKKGFENLPIKVDSDNDMESSKKVTVTAASANSWKLKDGNKSVDYILVADSNATTATTSYDFAAADINPTDGKTQASGVYVTEANYKAADSGTYTDTITFTSEVKAAS